MFIIICLYIYLIHVVKKFCACILAFALSPLSLLVLFYHSFNFFGMLPSLACMKKSNITNMPTLELPPSHSTFATDLACSSGWKKVMFKSFPNRIPSNPSVGSKGSYKISTDSIGRNSDRSSPLPSYHVEVI